MVCLSLLLPSESGGDALVEDRARCGDNLDATICDFKVHAPSGYDSALSSLLQHGLLCLLGELLGY